MQTKLGFVNLTLIFIILFAFVTRIYRLHVPEKYIFDEVYHVVTAKLIAKNDQRAFEWWHGPTEPNTAIDWLHPPLAKYTQAFFIKFLGENSYAWRLSSVVFGTGVIWATYELAQKLFKNKNLSLLAAWLATMDGLLLTQSRIAMNDIHVTFFILLTLIFYLQFRQQQTTKNLVLTGVSAGLALSSKWSGLFILVSISLLEFFFLLTQLKNKKTKWGQLFRKIGLKFLILGLLPFLVYLLSYWQMFLQGKDWSHLSHLHQQIWHYQTNLKATHPYQSRPWQWFLNLRPVWFEVNYDYPDQIANIYAFGNPVLLWAGAIFSLMTVLFLVWVKFFEKKFTDMTPLFILTFTYFMLWMPWQLSPRIMFFYHYAPAVPLLSIICGYWLNKIWQLKNTTSIRANKILVSVIIGLIFLAFVVWYPHWTNMPVPKDFADQIYFVLPSWR
jgi:dolichyl-phosphate-mannose-protein mannosyltransferase